jgi:hypothetical protein
MAWLLCHSVQTRITSARGAGTMTTTPARPATAARAILALDLGNDKAAAPRPTADGLLGRRAPRVRIEGCSFGVTRDEPPAYLTSKARYSPARAENPHDPGQKNPRGPSLFVCVPIRAGLA